MTIANLTEASLGLALDDPDLASILAGLDPTAAWEHDEGMADWVSHPAGVDVQGNSEHNRVTTVFFFNEGVESHEQYAGPLPRGLGFDWDRARIVSALGPADKSGPKHDCWIAEDHRLVVQYDAGGTITRISVTRM